MIPGLSNIKDVNTDEKMLVRVEAIINSMTKEERRTPKVLNGNRRKRIARGSGTSIQDVNRLIKQFTEMQRMMGKLNKKGFMNSILNNKNIKFN
jgi:signal recognition particle subunit SRP54